MWDLHHASLKLGIVGNSSLKNLKSINRGARFIIKHPSKNPAVFQRPSYSDLQFFQSNKTDQMKLQITRWWLTFSPWISIWSNNLHPKNGCASPKQLLPPSFETEKKQHHCSSVKESDFNPPTDQTKPRRISYYQK